MQQMSLESPMCKPDSIPQVVQLDIQPITMNIHKHETTTVINKNIIENDACNRMPIESKMRKNNNHNIESNISNSSQNIKSNINKKKRRMFWSAELNAVLTTLLSQYTTNDEIASRFLSQKPELNLTFDQVVRHIRKLKLGQIKNKSNPIQEDAQIKNKSNPIQEDTQIQNKSNPIQEDAQIQKKSNPIQEDVQIQNKSNPIQEDAHIQSQCNPIHKDAQIKNKCNTIPQDECDTIKDDTKVLHNELQNK
jgi:hypothetical protein